MFQVVVPIMLGLIGSLHCVGMCGPIALALPVHNFPKIKKHTAIALYNLGRTLAYVSLGVIVGSIGELFVVAGLQRFLSIITGALVLTFILFKYSNLFKFSNNYFKFKISDNIKNKLRFSISKNKLIFFALTGLLNGYLPCGLVYAALPIAASTGNVFYSSLFMFVFGLSTWPIMVALPYFSVWTGSKFKSSVTKTVPYMLSFMAILMIIRGLNLGIPYLSPKFITESKKVECCTHAPSTPHSKIICKPN
jgi:sulfite exporter TauE/SafE